MWYSLVKFRAVTSDGSVGKKERISAKYNVLAGICMGGHNSHCTQSILFNALECGQMSQLKITKYVRWIAKISWGPLHRRSQDILWGEHSSWPKICWPFFSHHPLLHSYIRHILPPTTVLSHLWGSTSPNTAPFLRHSNKMRRRIFSVATGVHWLRPGGDTKGSVSEDHSDCRSGTDNKQHRRLALYLVHGIRDEKLTKF